MMKSTHIFIILITLPLLLLWGCGKNKTSEKYVLEKADEVLDRGKARSALEYNDAIIGIQTEAINALFAIDWDVNLESFNLEMENLIKLVDSCLRKIDSIETYRHGEEFKEAFKEQLFFYQNLARNYYPELYNEYVLKVGSASNEESAEIKALWKKIEEIEEPIDMKIDRVQDAFAKKYGIELQESELQEKINNL